MTACGWASSATSRPRRRRPQRCVRSGLRDRRRGARRDLRRERRPRWHRERPGRWWRPHEPSAPAVADAAATRAGATRRLRSRRAPPCPTSTPGDCGSQAGRPRLGVAAAEAACSRGGRSQPARTDVPSWRCLPTPTGSRESGALSTGRELFAAGMAARSRRRSLCRSRGLLVGQLALPGTPTGSRIPRGSAPPAAEAVRRRSGCPQPAEIGHVAALTGARPGRTRRSPGHLGASRV
jgi:hypothetical protein